MHSNHSNTVSPNRHVEDGPVHGELARAAADVRVGGDGAADDRRGLRSGERHLDRPICTAEEFQRKCAGFGKREGRTSRTTVRRRRRRRREQQPCSDWGVVFFVVALFLFVDMFAGTRLLLRLQRVLVRTMTTTQARTRVSAFGAACAAAAATAATAAVALANPVNNAFFVAARCAPAPDLVAQLDALYARDNAAVYALAKSAGDAAPAAVLWRLARACHDLAAETIDAARKKQLTYEGFAAAKAALALDDSDFAVHKVYHGFCLFCLFVCLWSVFKHPPPPPAVDGDHAERHWYVRRHESNAAKRVHDAGACILYWPDDFLFPLTTSRAPGPLCTGH
jgi:hypothetical protein